MEPATAFARALRLFQSGQATQDELLTESYRQLSAEKASPATMLRILSAQQAANPLPHAIHEALLNRIINWPEDATVVTGSAEARRSKPPGPNMGDVLQGRFTLVELIGEGGMSRVFKAIDLRRVEAGSSDPYIAVKVLTEPFSEYFGSITALQREAQNLQKLAHPNIVRVIDCDRDGQTVFMTMEYLAGESLQRRLRTTGSAGVDPSIGEALVVSVGKALAYAHDHHIVHGDLKPGNIIITPDGEVKVIDFGMARFVTRSGGDSENAVPKALTPQYASPQIQAGQDAKPTDDVYALACIAYEVLTGTPPFGRRSQSGDAESRDLRSVLQRPANLPTHRYLALAKALAYEAEERTPSVQQFLSNFTGEKRQSRIGRRIAGAAILLAAFAGLYFVLNTHQMKSAPRVAAAIAVPGSVIRDCPTCPLMTVLPAGRFVQGAADSGDAEQLSFEQPRHEVSIGSPIAMSSNEVTVAEFREFAEATAREMSGCNTYGGQWQFQSDADWRNPGFAQGPAHPVTCTSWNDAVAYAEWLSGKSGQRYRLPSASEWEYAARGGADGLQPWSKDPTKACAYANVADQTAAEHFPGWTAFPCSDGYVGTAPAGSFKANAFGLNDLFGNVFEWVQDCWHADYVGAPSDGSARAEPACKEHELRGGSWFSAPRFVNAAYRNRFEADYRSSSIGFRLVRELAK